jgi:hypothetical protein
MVEDRKNERGKKKEETKTKKPLWEVPMEGAHVGKRKKLKTKKLRNSEARCTKEEKTEKEVNSRRRRKGK